MGLLCDLRGPCRFVVGVVHKELSCFVTAGPPGPNPGERFPKLLLQGRQCHVRARKHVPTRRAAIVAALLIELPNCLSPLYPEPPPSPSLQPCNDRIHPAMNTPASALRRKSQVFVEIPPSPLVSSRSGGGNHRVPHENTPLKAVAMNVDHPEPSSSSPTSNKLKRKSMGAPQTDHEGEGDARPPHSKKLKTDARSKTNGAADPAGKSGKGGKTEKKSDGQENTVRCHQCTRQSEPAGKHTALRFLTVRSSLELVAAVIECTYLRPTGQRCVLKYCKACMHNRYEKDIGTLKASGAANATTEGRSGHAGGLDYIYR